MAFEYITESATVDTLATFIETELLDIIDVEECNASVVMRLTQLLDIAEMINTYNS